jgi:hypothetical protein
VISDENAANRDVIQRVVKVPLKPNANARQNDSQYSPAIYNEGDSSSSMSAEVEIEWNWPGGMDGFRNNQMTGTHTVLPT